jgi:hypothetical protein
MRSAADTSLRAIWCAILLLALALNSCGSSGTVGELLAVFSAEATLNGEIAAAGDVIPGGARLTTNDTGVAEFRLEQPELTCKTFANAEVEISGTGGPVLRYVHGATVCRLMGEDDRPVLLTAHDQSLSVVRGVFRIDVNAEAALVQVSDGAVQIQAASADDGEGGATLVAAGQEAELSSTSPMRRQLSTAGLTSSERETMEEYSTLLEQEAETGPDSLDGTPSPEAPDSATPTSPEPEMTPTATTEPEETPEQEPSEEATATDEQPSADEEPPPVAEDPPAAEEEAATTNTSQ